MIGALPGLPLLPQHRGLVITERVRHQLYHVPGHTSIPSITTVLRTVLKSSTVPRTRTPKLTVWTQPQTNHSSPRVNRRLGPMAAGTAAHRVIAARLSGYATVVPSHVKPAVAGAMQYMKDNGLKAIAVEVPVWHPVHRCAGTADLVARDGDGVVFVVDWKRGEGIYDEYAYQLAAYARCVEALTGLVVGRVESVLLPPGRRLDGQKPYEKEPVLDIGPAWRTYLAAQELYEALQYDAFTGRMK